MSLSKEIRKDRWIGISIAILAAIIISFIPMSISGWFEFHCPHRWLFGFGCPLCGSTRAVNSLIHFRFYDAFVLNPAVYLFILFGLFEIINLIYNGRFEKGRRWVLIGVLISYILVYGYRIIEFLV